MGGSTPQQSSSQSNQSSNSSTAPNSFVQPFLQMGVQGLVDNYNANPQAPGYYPGSTVASPSSATSAGLTNLFNRGASGSPLQATGNSFAQSVLDPNYLNVGNDPNFQASLAAGFAPQNLNFQNTTLPNIRSQFEGSGRNLGGADMGQSQLALQNLDQTQSNASAQAVEQAYQQRMSNQFNVLNNYIPASQNMDYQNIAAQQASGAAQDQYNQALTDSNVARYNYNSTAQPAYLSNFLSGVLAGYPGGQTTGNSSGYQSGFTTPPSNNTSSFLGGGLGLAGLALQAAPLFGASDARLKEDITPLAKLDNGLNLYSYKFIDSPKTHIGLLAQEVEKVHPDAVITHPSGIKMVNYEKATAPAGGLF